MGHSNLQKEVKQRLQSKGWYKEVYNEVSNKFKDIPDEIIVKTLQ